MSGSLTEADSIDKDVTVLREAGSQGEEILTQYDWDCKNTNKIWWTWVNEDRNKETIFLSLAVCSWQSNKIQSKLG